MGFTTASFVQQQRQHQIRITTGCRALDELLGGTPHTDFAPLRLSLRRVSLPCPAPYSAHRSLQAEWRPAVSQKSTASSEPARRSSATCSRSPARHVCKRSLERSDNRDNSHAPSPAWRAARRWRGQGDVHRHRGHVPAGPSGEHSRAVRFTANQLTVCLLAHSTR